MGLFPSVLEQVPWLQSTTPASPHAAFKELVTKQISLSYALFSDHGSSLKNGGGELSNTKPKVILLQKG